LDTLDDVFDSDSSKFWDPSSLSSADALYFWPHALGDFSILYAQMPFFRSYVSNLSRDFQFVHQKTCKKLAKIVRIFNCDLIQIFGNHLATTYLQ
jgi:hypothetical protein